MAKKLLKEQLGFCLVVLLLLTATPAEAANIFQTITERAATALTSIKQLVFVLAGFGIIAFAFAAIFGKLSWKHFANIAIGLFLVASMGLFIQYFVTKDGENYKLAYGNYLGSAFGDTAGTAGDGFGGADDSSGAANQLTGGGTDTGNTSGTSTSGGKVSFDPVTGMPTIDGGLSGGAGSGGLAEGATNSTQEKEKRGFKGFISDIKNVANAAQQAKNAVDAGINFAKNAAATYENVKNSVENNGTGLQGILNSVSDVAGGIKDVKQGAESTVSTVGSKVSEVANSVQDVGKTEAEIQENRMIRTQGGETNEISEWLNREGKGGSTANEVKDRVDTVANPVLDNVGSAAYDVKGVANMTDKGVSGAIGAAVGVAAGTGAIANTVGNIAGSRSSSEAAAEKAVDNYKNTVKEAQEKLASGEISQKEFDKMTQKAKKKMQRRGILAISDDPLVKKEAAPNVESPAQNAPASNTPTLDRFLNGGEE